MKKNRKNLNRSFYEYCNANKPIYAVFIVCLAMVIGASAWGGSGSPFVAYFGAGILFLTITFSIIDWYRNG